MNWNRMGWVWRWVVLIAGIGAYIAQQSTGASNTTVILAATVWAGLLGLVLDLLLTGVQGRLLRWHHTRLGETE